VSAAGGTVKLLAKEATPKTEEKPAEAPAKETAPAPKAEAPAEKAAE